MATHNSVQYAKEVAVPVQLRSPDEMHGRLRVAVAEYTCATFNNGDILNCFTLPYKANVLGGFMEQDALGASTTIKIGYTGADDAMLAATSTASAAREQLPKFAAIRTDFGNKLIIATLGGGNATDGKKLRIVVYYVVA